MSTGNAEDHVAMRDVGAALNAVRARIGTLERRFRREPGSVRLLAVSKTKPPEAVRAAIAAGQHAFGENHLQDAMTKVEALARHGASWHFIGAVQSNKTRPISACFDWVHGIEREKIATRLSAQRPRRPRAARHLHRGRRERRGEQVRRTTLGGRALARVVRELPGLRLRGLMAIPRPSEDFDSQRIPFRLLREILDDLNAKGLGLDTLSMGMTGDLEAAVAEGATIVRIGTAIFGPRRGTSRYRPRSPAHEPD